MSVEILNKINKTCDVIVEQQSKIAIETTLKNGPGICFYRTFNKLRENGSNCAFNYAVKDSDPWNYIKEISSNWDQVMKGYDHNSDILISVHIPSTEVDDGNSYGVLYKFKVLNDKLVKC